MNLKHVCAVLLACAYLAGCGPKIFNKPGATQQDFTTDNYTCNKDVHQSGNFGTGLVGALNVQNYYEQCMNAHGWYVQAAPAAPPVVSYATPTLSRAREHLAATHRLRHMLMV